jgi:hypothetical protein
MFEGDIEEEEEAYEEFKITEEIQMMAKVSLLSYILLMVNYMVEFQTANNELAPGVSFVSMMILSTFLFISTSLTFPNVPFSPLSLYINYFLGKAGFITTVVFLMVQLSSGILAVITIIHVVPMKDPLKCLVFTPDQSMSMGRQFILQTAVVAVATCVTGIGRHAWTGDPSIALFYKAAILPALKTMGLNVLGGGGVNTIIPLAPALLSNKYTGLWVYIIGDILGVILGLRVMIYFCTKESPT